MILTNDIQSQRKKIFLTSIIFPCFGLLLLLVFFGNLLYGSIHIPASVVWDILLGKDVERITWVNTILQLRLPQAITALLAGSGLAVCGLMLQTLFKNPLAGPSILGISDGANLGVAVVILLLGGNMGSFASFTLGGSMLVIIGAFVGASVVLIFILSISTKVRDTILLLIIGLMIGYLASSGIYLLNYFARTESVHSFVMWGMGNFSGVSLGKLPFFAAMVLAGLLFSTLFIKPLNALLLGEKYAANLGVHVNRTRLMILICTGLLTATITAFCGPISFIGLAVPHIARILFRTANHQILLPITILLGGIVALFCNLLTILPFGSGLLPLNAVTPLLGGPVIIYVILKRNN